MNLKNLKVKDLILISNLDRFDSLRAYARHMSMEPQNLSKKIDTIEKSINTKLFERSPLGIVMTSNGNIIINKIKAVLQDLYEIENIQLKDYNSKVTFCSRGYLVSYLSSYLINLFSKELPEVRLQLLDLSPEATESAGRKNIINLALSFDDIDFGKSWKKDKVGKMPFSFFVRHDHPLSGEVSPGKLKNFKFVGFTYIEKNKLVNPKLESIQGVTLQSGFAAENSIYSKKIILNSHQIASLPLVTVLDEVAQGQLRPIKIKGTKSKSSTVHLHTHLDHITNTSYKLIKYEVEKAFQNLQQLKNKYL